mmetsp:Transcript_7947/g.19204  ORF Transcript_7947/g.19204 Transcript_7947/m.19204 type:complete len:302 (+) Transcript_7947:2-907(+)
MMLNLKTCCVDTLYSSTMLAFLISISALALGNVVVQASSPSWTIYHSWNADQEFSRRGELTWSEEEGALQVTNDDGEESSALSNENIQAMLDYGWYHVKIENPGTNDFVLATVPACNLRRANFKDEFQVTLPRTQESQITSLAYLPLASPLAPKSCDEMGELESPKPFISKVSLTLDTPGMIMKAVLPSTKPPPGMQFIPHPNLKKNAAANAAGGGAKGNGKPQIPGAPPEEPEAQSFLRRYWYIILPLMLANLMAAPAAPEGEPGQEGDAAGGAPAAVADSAPAAAASGGSKQRRGKRRN